MSVLILLFGLTLAFSTLFVFGVLCFAKKRSVLDQIDYRKVHTEQIPKLGGLYYCQCRYGACRYDPDSYIRHLGRP